MEEAVGEGGGTLLTGADLLVIQKMEKIEVEKFARGMSGGPDLIRWKNCWGI